ncbi:hypothetical protein [Methanooceanicella nereidis]|nr:hypothetical protein [Methanocella sp. CWC-04]
MRRRLHRKARNKRSITTFTLGYFLCASKHVEKPTYPKNASIQ